MSHSQRFSQSPTTISNKSDEPVLMFLSVEFLWQSIWRKELFFYILDCGLYNVLWDDILTIWHILSNQRNAILKSIYKIRYKNVWHESAKHNITCIKDVWLFSFIKELLHSGLPNVNNGIWCVQWLVSPTVWLNVRLSWK